MGACNTASRCDAMYGMSLTRFFSVRHKRRMGTSSRLERSVHYLVPAQLVRNWLLEGKVVGVRLDALVRSLGLLLTSIFVRPSSTWVYPSSFLSLIPDFWAGLNWHSYQGPGAPPSFNWFGRACANVLSAQGWQCDGKSGTDGWSFDYNGKGLPSGLPVGFRFFGSNFGSNGGWAPPTG